MAAHNLNNTTSQPTASQPTALTRRALLTAGGVGLVGGVALLSGCAPTALPAAATGAVLTKLSNVPVGGSFNVDLEGNGIVVSQPTAGVVTAFSSVCTHQGCKVGGRNGELDCPCHGSKFDITTGVPTIGPATTPLVKIEVTIDGDNIVIA